MKRANGSGTIRKQKGRRNPYAAYRSAVYADGVAIREYIGSFKTKKDAEIALALDYTRPRSEYERFTLRELWEKWSRTRAYTQLSKSGQQGYFACFNYYMDDFHDKRFRDLRRDDFQSMIDKADDMGKSTSTMTKIRAVASILSEYAVSLDVVPHSYATKLIVPKREKTEIQIFTPEEIARLFSADDPIAETVLIMIYTGMRISEMLNLKTSDVDLDRMVIVGGCKTDAGRNRTIPIHKLIAPFIQKRATGEYLIDENGKHYRPEHYRDVYFACLERLGIRRLTPHKARHTFFSMVDAATTDKLAMAIVGGHTDPSFTESVYVHPDLDRLRAVIDAI